jgi:hypothetical protein
MWRPGSGEISTEPDKMLNCSTYSKTDAILKKMIIKYQLNVVKNVKGFCQFEIMN